MIETSFSYSMEYCWKHQTLRPVATQCYQCAAEAYAASLPQRDTLNVLEARIADLEAETLDLRRQANALRHIALDLQQAHNALIESTIYGSTPEELAESILKIIDRRCTSRLP